MGNRTPVGLYHVRTKNKPGLLLETLEAVGMTDDEIKAELKQLQPQWMRRAMTDRDKLRQAGNDTSRERWVREGLFEMGGLIETFKGRKFKSGLYLFEILYQMLDSGYTAVTGIYATKPDGSKTNLHRVWVADCMRAIIRAQSL